MSLLWNLFAGERFHKDALGRPYEGRLWRITVISAYYEMYPGMPELGGCTMEDILQRAERIEIPPPILAFYILYVSCCCFHVLITNWGGVVLR